MALNLVTLHRATPAEQPVLAELNEALVRELLTRTKGAGMALLCGTLLLWMIIGPWTGGSQRLLFPALAACAVIRTAGAIWIKRRPRERFRTMPAFSWFAAMTLCIGLCLGALVMTSYASLPPLSLVMCAALLIGFNSTAMVSLAGSPLVYLCYVTANMAAMTYTSFAHPLRGMELELQIINLVYIAVLMVMMGNVHRSLRHGLLLRLQLAASLRELGDTQARLVESSRLAGRADVARAMLHNVGNVLNSVNVSAELLGDLIVRSKSASLDKAIAMMLAHRSDLPAFFRDDPRAQKLPDYLRQVSEIVGGERRTAIAELQALSRNIDHIKAIVQSQQQLTAPVHVDETITVQSIIDDAIKFSAPSLARGDIEVIHRLDDLPPVTTDRHKALQILMNLLANASDAVMANRAGERQITVRSRRDDGGRLEIAIEDNGCGIDPAHLDKIFTLGFTTKLDGHGLGLHFSACAARELKGNLCVRSAGVGSGASFVLALPFRSTSAEARRTSLD